MARVRDTYLGMIAVCVLAMTPFVFSACGGGGAEYTAGGAYEPLADPAVAPNAPEVAHAQNPESKPEPVPLSFEDLIRSDLYAGHLVVHLDKSVSTPFPLSEGQGEGEQMQPRYQSPTILALKDILSRFPSAKIARAVDAPADELDRAREKLERLSGKKLTDWNYIHHIETFSPDDAIAIMNKLRTTHGVTKVYPAVIASPTGILDTPPLTSYQAYLKNEDAYGGLNAEAAWAVGVRGEGVYIVDDEVGINLGHEDLGLVDERFANGGSYLIFPICVPGYPSDILDCPFRIAHGTAVAGILSALDNDHGVKGFAPLSHYVHSGRRVTSTYGALQGATDGIDLPASEVDDDIEPGSIWVIEGGIPGRFSAPGPCDGSAACQYGYVPTELLDEDFAAIEQASAYGVTVVSGAANGQMNLDNPELYTGDWSTAHNLATDDAGSIMVGASEGANEEMAFFSNCGTRVNAFAWGQGVVTTGYPYGLYGWAGALPPGLVNNPADPNNFYVDNFGGTSSAAAMVGGAAALVQSYARSELGHRRYLMPAKMREIIVGSGVPQADTGGCNIGRQPRVDEAMNLVDSFLATARASYPELDSGAILTEERMLSLRDLGIGIICREFDPTASDPICPEGEFFPVGERLAKDLDFDGDGRADLVQWTNGSWKLDLSSRGAGGDNFGAWDIEIEYEPIAGQWVWPYVIDMNRDARTDFVVYDKEHGKWYIAFTNSALIRNGTWHGWDWEIDYSATWTDMLTPDPLQTDPAIPDPRYSRPVPGDYNNDGWIDIAIACSDGNWRIDHGGPNRADFGAFDRTVRYLSDAQLEAAPGWAYPVSSANVATLQEIMIFKVPDSIPDAGELSVLDPADLSNWAADIPHEYGGNDEILLFDNFCFLNDREGAVSKKASDGTWKISRFYDLLFGTETFEDVFPSTGWGGIECIPLSADFNGDGWADRAVMCPDEWRISYANGLNCTSPQSDFRHIPLRYDRREFSLPGRSYSGGITYSYTRELIEFFQMSNTPDTDSPIPIDMPAVFSF